MEKRWVWDMNEAVNVLTYIIKWYIIIGYIFNVYCNENTICIFTLCNNVNKWNKNLYGNCFNWKLIKIDFRNFWMFYNVFTF